MLGLSADSSRSEGNWGTVGGNPSSSGENRRKVTSVHFHDKVKRKLTAPWEPLAHNIPQTADYVDQFLDFPPLRRQLFPHPRVFIPHRIQLRSHLNQLDLKREKS